MAEASKPHIVAIPFLSQGHINPLIHFCFNLAQQGINVTFVTILIEPVAFFGTRDPQIPPHLSTSVFHRHITLHRPVLSEQASLQERRDRFFRAVDDLGAPFEQLIHEIQQQHNSKVCCVVSDCMYSWTRSVCNKLGIQRVGFWTASLAALIVDCHAPLLLENEDFPVTESNARKIISYIPGLAPFPAATLPFMFHANNMMFDLDTGLQRMAARSVILRDDAWLVVNSFEDLEPEVFKAVRETVNKSCIGVGPLVPPRFLGLEKQSEDEDVISPGAASLWEQDTDCLKWLDQQASASVLYISFGSAVKLTNAEFKSLCKALETCKQHFLWVFREGNVEGLPDEEVADFKSNFGASTGLITEWAPQVEILLHRATGAFLTHCGWNSVLESICGGVPMLGWPKLAEQNLNCEFLVGKGIGLRLTDDVLYQPVGAEEMAARIQKVMRSLEMREKSRELQMAAKSAARNGQSLLLEFITHVHQLNSELTLVVENRTSVRFQ